MTKIQINSKKLFDENNNSLYNNLNFIEKKNKKRLIDK